VPLPLATPAAPAPKTAGAAPPPPQVAAPAPGQVEIERFAPDRAIADARKRVEQLSGGDRAALARARTELGILLEVAGGDPASALAEYRAAHGIAANMLAPLAAARRLTPLHLPGPALALLEAELRAEPAANVTRLLEKGMLLRADGAPADRTGEAYRELLSLRPDHPGALRGLETTLATAHRTTDAKLQMEALANHLATVAAAFRSDPRLSAWIEVERGQLLERLGRAEAARAAFEAGLALDAQIGPVRDAYTQHLLIHDQVEALVEAWASEAMIDSDGARTARLLYCAGRLAAERLEQKPQAIELFERAASSESAAPAIRRAALRELFRLYEAAGSTEAAVKTGERLLVLARDREKAFWHRRLVAGCEALGRFAEMAMHAHHVLADEPEDEPMRDKLDGALASLGQHEQRVTMFTDQAARAGSVSARIDLLLRAAHIAEHDLGRTDLALLALRSAFAVDPSHADTTDAIVRLLSPGTPPSLTDANDPSRVRARIDFYLEAAAASTDAARKIAHFEKLAYLWEDEVRAPDRALAVFDEILTLDPQRRSAILGLARCAAKAGNARELLRALMLEADQAGDDIFLERSLLLRAADVASQQLGEPDTALELIKRVIDRTGGDPAVFRAAFRIHERAGRQGDALAQLRLLLGQTRKGQSNYAVQAEIARFLEERMHRSGDALSAWREAHRKEPSNPTPRAEIRRILLGTLDHRAVADELAVLAAATAEPVERGELLLEAAEIHDDRLNDPERAIPLLSEARSLLPDDPLIVERLDRAYLRTHRRAERLALLHASETPDPRCQLALASMQVEERDPQKALKRLADLSSHPVAGVAALRILEHALRRSERTGELDALLRRQIESFGTLAAKLGSVFELVALEEYGKDRFPDWQPSARELLARLAPEEMLHHELFLRSAGLDFESAVSWQSVATSLAALAAATPDPHRAGSLQLAAALIIEHRADGSPNAQWEALRAFAAALGNWPDCLSAARGARRMALLLGDAESFFKAAAALGELELDPPTRCERFLEAADGYRARPDRVAQALDLYCRALSEHPDSVRAADAVTAAVAQGLDPGKAGETLRGALERAQSPDQSAKLGTALAQVAVRYLGDQTVALEALRRARKRAPRHVEILLTLADLSHALGLRTEAVEAATSARGLSRDPGERFRAAVTLAEIHVQMPAFRETARREAAEAEKLAEQVGPLSGDLVSRLGAVFSALGEEQSAERVLIAAVTLSAESASALDHLVTMFGTDREGGQKAANALTKVLSLADAKGLPKRAEWLAALGRIEATLLGMQREGLARLRQALHMAPGRAEIYRALAEAHGPAHEEAAREILGMFAKLGRSSPTCAQVAAILSVLANTYRQGLRTDLAAVAEEFLDYVAKLPSGAEAAGRGQEQTLPVGAPMPGALARDAVVSMLLPDSTQAPYLEIASLVWEAVAKLVRIEPETLGASARDRLTSRALHPVRALADRVARVFGDLRFDLFVDAGGTKLPRLLPGDPPALVLPPGFAAESEIEQAAALARLLAYVALDIPWVEEVTPDDVDGILFGAMRTGLDLWGQGELSPAAEINIGTWYGRVSKAVGRRVKRTLEETVSRIRAQPDTSAWRQAVSIIGLRAAYVVTGTLPASMKLAARLDGELAAATGDSLAAKLLENPITRELALFALSESALALRRAAGTA